MIKYQGVKLFFIAIQNIYEYSKLFKIFFYVKK